MGELHRVSAVVYNQADEPIPGITLTWSIPSGEATIVEAASATNNAGVAWADVRSLAPGTVSVRCSAGAAASGTISVVWVAAVVPDPDPDPDPEPSEGGLPGVVVFLIMLMILGAGTFLFLRWRKRKTETVADDDLDPLDTSQLPQL